MIFAEDEIAAQEALTAERVLEKTLSGDDW
jgi:hypothetical protein